MKNRGNYEPVDQLITKVSLARGRVAWGMSTLNTAPELTTSTRLSSFAIP